MNIALPELSINIVLYVVKHLVAFIVTRPIGASLGDLFIQAPVDGGLGISAGTINIVFFAIIIAVVTYLSISKVDVFKGEKAC